MFRVTRAVRDHAEKEGCHPALVKLWSKYTPVDGQVTRHLAASETKIITPFLQMAPYKIGRKVQKFGPHLTVLFLYVYGTVKFTVWADHEMAHMHRS